MSFSLLLFFSLGPLSLTARAGERGPPPPVYERLLHFVVHAMAVLPVGHSGPRYACICHGCLCLHDVCVFVSCRQGLITAAELATRNPRVEAVTDGNLSGLQPWKGISLLRRYSLNVICYDGRWLVVLRRCLSHVHSRERERETHTPVLYIHRQTGAGKREGSRQSYSGAGCIEPAR